MIEEDRRRRKSGGIFGEDFVERDRLRLVGIVTQLRCEMSGYEAELLGMDRGWIVVAVCSAGICSKYGEKGCLSLS